MHQQKAVPPAPRKNDVNWLVPPELSDLIVCEGDLVSIMHEARPIRSIPTKTFDGLINKWNLGDMDKNDSCSYRGAKIQVLFLKDKRRHCSTGPLTVPRIRLSYKNWHIDMWEVTWDFISSNGSPDWRRLVELILDQKQILPLLLHIDTELEELK